MTHLKRFASLGLAATVGACEFMRPPTAVELGENPIVVHAVLTTGSEVARVLLTRVAEREQTGEWPVYGPGIEPVSGAEVWLIAGGDSLRLTEAPAEFLACVGSHASRAGADSARRAEKGCYAAGVPGGVRAGVLYSLAIRLPDGSTIEGRAVPPPAPELLAPEPHAHVTVRPMDPARPVPDMVKVRFSAAADVAGVELSLQPISAFAAGERVPDAQCGVGAGTRLFPRAQGDTASLPIYGLSCHRLAGDRYESVSADSIHARLYVTAYDARFMRYQEAIQQRQVHPETVTEGLTGALGLFAGAATTHRTITVIPLD